MTFDDLIALKEKADSLRSTQEERDAAVKIAELRKVQKLARNPMMDRVAVALNKEPDPDEVDEVSEILRYAKALGFGLLPEPV